MQYYYEGGLYNEIERKKTFLEVRSRCFPNRTILTNTYEFLSKTNKINIVIGLKMIFIDIKNPYTFIPKLKPLTLSFPEFLFLRKHLFSLYLHNIAISN